VRSTVPHRDDAHRDDARAQAPATILLVEDDVLVRDVMAEELRDCGYRVIGAANAEEAFSIAATGLALDAVVADVELPGPIDGIEVTRRLRQGRADVVVVITSGVAPRCPTDALPGRFFLKPYRIESLTEHLELELRQRHHETRRRSAGLFGRIRSFPSLRT
jgi:CheY-like chemotaxis protein